MTDLEICPRYAQFSKSTPSRLPDRFLLGDLINKPQFPHTNSPDWLPWILVVFDWTTAYLSGGACLECPVASTFGKDRQSYAFMAGKPAPSSHESPGKWNQEPVTLIIGGGVGKSPIWCIQGWPRLRHYTDRWPTTRWRALLLTALKIIQFHVKYIF